MVSGTRGRVLVTRPAEQAAELAALLTEAGYEPVVAPTVAIEPAADLSALDGALRHIDAYRWVVLASANAARVVTGRAAQMRVDRRALAQTEFITGPAGARALSGAGLDVGRVLSPFSAARVLEELAAEAVAGARVLLPRAEEGREELAGGLRARGAAVDEVVVYRTVPATRSDTLVSALRAGVDAATFFSPSAVRGFVAALRSEGLEPRRELSGVTVACLGGTTAAEARARGLRVDVIPEATTAAALVDALVHAPVAETAVTREAVWSA